MALQTLPQIRESDLQSSRSCTPVHDKFDPDSDVHSSAAYSRFIAIAFANECHAAFVMRRVHGLLGFASALAHPVCHAVIMLEPKSFFDRSRWPDLTKAAVIDSLYDADSVILLSFMTSDVVPTEHFTGGGISYGFVIHPKTYAVVYAELGSWRT